MTEMDPSQVDFFAEKSLVFFVPNFTHDVMYLISGDVGPFVPGVPLQVPLWLALNLKLQCKGRLVAPDWMDVATLDAKKSEETESQLFTRMPCEHYMEVTNMILAVATEDVPRSDEVRTLVKDIWDLRMAKLRSSIDAFIQSDEIHAKVDHLTLMEINTVRLLLTKSLNHLGTIRKVISNSA